MPQAPRFLVVEYDGAGLPFVDWARGRPGMKLDLILEPMRAEGRDLQVPGIALVRGLDADALLDLPALLDRSYAPHRTLRRDARRGEWLGRVTLHVANMAHAPAALAVARHAGDYAPPWSHVEQGVVHMRIRVPDGADADAMAATLRSEMAGRGGDAHVAVETHGQHDHGVWDQLVQASLGLAP
jgi:hypothetical protein